MTRITYDTEFIDDGRTIDLVSLGMVREDTGETLYAINREMNVENLLANPWLVKNVWNSLPTIPCEKGRRCHTPQRYNQHLDRDHPDVRPRRQIARMVQNFILGAPNPQLWAYYSAYDHVAYAQLFGPMIELPKGCPMNTLDIKQEMIRLGLESADMPRQAAEGEHNALADAQHNLVMLKHLDGVEAMRTLPQDVARRGGFDD